MRTSVPGNGSEERVYARFTAQWWSAARKEWLTVAGAGTTDWVYVGTSEYTAQQAGWTYHFSSPPTGSTYVMRGGHRAGLACARTTPATVAGMSCAAAPS